MFKALEIVLAVGAIGTVVYVLRVAWRELGELDRLRQSGIRSGRHQASGKRVMAR